MKKGLYILFILLAIGIDSFGQFKFGTDIYSRYIWRGVDYGNAPSFQPTLSYTTGGLILGAWGAYSFPGNSQSYAENDLYINYIFTSEKSGSFSLLLTDYYIPSLEIPFGYYQKKNGAHTFEPGIIYSGPENFPITLALYNNISNDDDHSSYVQLGYSWIVNNATVTFLVGFTPSKSAYYGADKGTIINLGFSATKSVVITEKFAIPFTVSYISNPNIDKTYLVFGASLVF